MIKMDLDKAITDLKKLRAKKVLVQIPEGLKVRTEEIATQLEKEGLTIVLAMEPCFGACDIKVDEAKRLGCDTVLHFGHNAFMQINEIPVVYAPLQYELKNYQSLSEKLIKHLQKKNVKTIGLVTTVQYADYVPKIIELLKKEGINTKTQKGPRVEEAQVLGCNYSAVPSGVDTIVYFGDGLFHPLGIHFSAQSEVIICNPATDEVSELGKEKDKFLRQRILLIERAKEARSYAILVSSKVGQERMKFAESIKTELIMHGKEAQIYAMDFISESKLLGTHADAYINTACPRISIDDFFAFKKPIINGSEVKYLLGKSYDDYKLDAVY